MASYIKTLKEDNGDITYPQTLGSAVLLSGGADLETELGKFVTAEDIATTSALTPPVQTAMIADDAVTPAKASFTKYSTSEQVVGEWTDGSTIYRKTIYAGNLPNASVKTVNHGISNIDRIVKMDAFAKDSVAFTPLPFPGTASNPAGFIQVAITSTAISIGTGADRSSATAYITLYYTKSS